MSLVKALNYSLQKPLASQGKPEILRFRSDNSEYKSGDMVRIEIPCGRQGQHLYPLSSYIEGSISVNYVGTGHSIVCLDGNVFSLFKRLRVTHGTNPLEDTLHPNRLWNCIYDLQRNATERAGEFIG